MAMIEDKAISSQSHDIVSLLSSTERDFLIRNNHEMVKLTSLIGKTVGLYFSASWCGPCRRFTPNLVRAYEEISAKSHDFEVVFISSDRDEESFNAYFKKMPWVALPFSDSELRKKLKMLFHVRGIPHLMIFDRTGKVVTEEANDFINDFGADAYPFTPETINAVKEGARKEQSLRSLLVNHFRDYLISSDGNEVPVIELEGKTIGLYFSENSLGFNKILVEFYEKLKERGEDFKIVLVSLDDDEQGFRDNFGTMPWLSLPFRDNNRDKLLRHFEIRTAPTLVVIGPDGKTLHPNVVESVAEHGVEAYPFTPEKLAELGKVRAQTLESILVSGDRDFVIAKNGSKVPVSELVGKNILLYFSAQWCPPCRDFLPKFISVYEEIKAKDDAFEVIYISSDRDHFSFEDYFYAMPWLALPFGDERKAQLHNHFKVKGIPAIVAIGPNGRTVSTHVRQLIQEHGAEAYPFNHEHVKSLEQRVEEMAQAWPAKLKHELHHKHQLVLARRSGYVCGGCQGVGYGWSYLCDECSFDLHPKCALKKEESKSDHHHRSGSGSTKGGYVCDGDVCRKA